VRRNTVRFRVTALATAMVALGLIASAVALVLLQRSSLTSSLDQALIGRADDIESLFADGVVPDVFPATLTEGFVQLVGFDGSVMASTPNLAGQPAIQIAESSGSVGDSIANVSGLGVDDDEFRVLTRPVGAGGVLYVGTTFDTVGESVSVLTTSIALVIPPLVVLFAALIWWMVGKTLQPVEDIRSEVSEIGVTDLHRRVPRPGTEDEIDRLAGTMNEMLDRVERSIDRQQRFVADASHELRSPLTRMRTRLELESSEVSRSGEGETLGSLLDEVIGMQSLVEDLLYLAKADAGSGTGKFERVDLDDLVLREARRIEARGRVGVDLSQVSGAQVMGDPGQLTRALRNLLENGERHASSRLWLSLGESGSEARFTVSDDGPGIPPEQEDHIFERFGRLDEARSFETGGAGLGLAIARDIAEQHHGFLRLVGGGAPGATFEMVIPVAV